MRGRNDGEREWFEIFSVTAGESFCASEEWLSLKMLHEEAVNKNSSDYL